jgi:hypothetical protein
MSHKLSPDNSRVMDYAQWKKMCNAEPCEVFI